MNMATAEAQVKVLDEARAELARVLGEKEAARRAILEPVRESLDVVDAEYQNVIAVMQDGVAEAEAKARAAVLAVEHSVHAGKTMVTFVPGGWKWDAAGLNGVVTVVPQLAGLRTPTAPQTRVGEWKGKGE